MRRSLSSVCAVILIGLLLVASLQAAGTATVSSRYNGVITVQWTSTAGGAVSGNAFAVPRGTISQVKFVPGTSGSQPSDAYDVTLVDPDGVDVLAGLGANLSNASAATVTTMGVLTEVSTLDLVIANAGNAKSGTVTIWIR